MSGIRRWFRTVLCCLAVTTSPGRFVGTLGKSTEGTDSSHRNEVIFFPLSPHSKLEKCLLSERWVELFLFTSTGILCYLLRALLFFTNNFFLRDDFRFLKFPMFGGKLAFADPIGAG